MAYNIDPPSIHGSSPEARIMQIERYLHILSQNLNFALNALDRSATEGSVIKTDSKTGAKGTYLENVYVKDGEDYLILSDYIRKYIRGE